MTELREQAKLAYDRALAQKNLKESMSARMLLSHAGGLWTCDQSLIALLQCYQDETEIALLDANDIPRKINVAELLFKVKQRHQEIMNEWLTAYAALARIRTGKDV